MLLLEADQVPEEYCTKAAMGMKDRTVKPREPRKATQHLRPGHNEVKERITSPQLPTSCLCLLRKGPLPAKPPIPEKGEYTGWLWL